ncbi:MAG: patatin-like phospholipase family protein [Bacteroidales bacterium]|nr:patatin-like phospholipase family protein [Bacteroidales bacterium]
MEKKGNQSQKEFKILSIDGGGIRGVFPAQILAEIESHLKAESEEKEDINIYEYFDLICGTSTGGVLAIALGLGISATQLKKLYLKNVQTIFGSGKSFVRNFFGPKHDIFILEKIVRKCFKDKFGGNDPILGESKTRLCVPVYDSYQGTLNVLKTSHHPDLINDWQIPAYQAAVATSAAPTYYNPYTLDYIDRTGERIIKKNKVDGGICANNPVLVGFLEAVHTLNKKPSNLKVLSLGTGTKQLRIKNENEGWGFIKWLKGHKLIDLSMQSQSDMIQNQIKFINQGIGVGGKSAFHLNRIQYDFSLNANAIKLDESRSDILDEFIVEAKETFKKEGPGIIKHFFQNKVEPYKPYHYG